MTNLTKQQLLEGRDALPPLAVRIPEWDATAHIVRMHADQKDAVELAWGRYRQHQLMDEDERVGIRAFFAAFALCDEQGERFFQSDSELFSAAAKLSARDGRAVGRLYNAYILHNAITEADVAELEKN